MKFVGATTIDLLLFLDHAIMNDKYLLVHMAFDREDVRCRCEFMGFFFLTSL